MFDLDVFEIGHQLANFGGGVGLGAGALEAVVHAAADGLGAPEAVAEPEHESSERGVVVEHDAGVAAGFENAEGFAQAAGGVGAVVHDAVGIDDVEAVVGEGEIFGVGEAEIGSEAGEFAAAAGAVERSLGEIDAGGEGSGFEPLFVVGAHAYTDFEDALPAGCRESSEVWDVGFERVTDLGVGCELGGVAEITGATRLGVPEIGDLGFEAGVVGSGGIGSGSGESGRFESGRSFGAGHGLRIADAGGASEYKLVHSP